MFLRHGEVDARLPADARVHHRRERRRRLHEAYAAEERRRDVAREVAHHTATDRDDDVAALRLPLCEPLVDHGGGRQALARLARREREHPHLDAGGVQRPLRGPAVRMDDVAVADDERPPGEPRLHKAAPQLLLERVPPHEHRVSALLQSHGRGEVRVVLPRRRSAQPPPRAHDLVRGLLDRQVVRMHGPVRPRVRPLALALQRLDAPQRIVRLQHRPRHRLCAVQLRDVGEPPVDRLGTRLQRHHQPRTEHPAERLVVHHRPGASRDDDALLACELRDGRALQLAERGLAVLGEDASNRLAGALDDALVGVLEPPAQETGGAASDGALSRAGEPDEIDAVARGHGRKPTSFTMTAPTRCLRR